MRDNPQAKRSGVSGYWDKMFAENPQEGVAKTEKKIQDTLKEIDTSMNLMQEMSADVKEEMKRFHQVKCADFKRMMMAHVREQIDFHSKVSETWTSMLPHIQAIEAGHSTNPSGSSMYGMASAAEPLN